MKLIPAKLVTFFTYAFCVIIISFFSSCFKNDPPTPVAYLNVVHASPKMTSLEFSLDQNRVDYNSFNYKAYTGYINVFPGTRAFKVYKKDENTALLTKNIQLTEKSNYTLFIADTLSKMEAVLIKDSSRAPLGDSVRIRFANMTPDVPAMNVYIQGKAEPIATSITYKNAGDFFSLKAAENVVFEVKATGQSTVLATSESKNLYKGGYYTVFSSGFKSQTDDAKVSVGLMRH